MEYKVSKDYPRLKQLLDSGHWVACWMDYDVSFGFGEIRTYIAEIRKSKGKLIQVYEIFSRGFVLWELGTDFKEDCFYEEWARLNLQFVDPIPERNTLELEHFSLNEWREEYG